MNRKLRENYATIKDSGPSATSGSIPVPGISNDPFAGAATPTRSSGPRTLPNSSLGAKQITRHVGSHKA